ncbi:DUF1080 domain-containing protein, partial [candidate division KSB1 bacterium]
FTACSKQEEIPAGPNTLTKQEIAEGWKLLFDGETLNGWKTANPGTWKVEEGTVTQADSGGMGSGGMIWTVEQYGNFILECEYKLQPKCNSGIFFRVGDLDNHVQTGFEMQVADSYGSERINKHSSGALYDLVVPSSNAAKPAGNWNHAVVYADDNIVTLKLNGVTVVENVNLDEYTTPNMSVDGTKNKFKTAIKDFPRVGYIGFQQHGGNIWYRSIKIKEL